MIPKVIHYVWLGGNKKSKFIKKCIKSWKKYCPDYKIIEWNETNFDINSVQYVQEACNEKKWAFASDYIRLFVLYNYGGIYMDTDVQVIKPLDKFLQCKAFSGFENPKAIPTGIMACEQYNEMFGHLLSYYKDKSFYKENGEMNLTTNVITITNMCLNKGLILNNEYQNIDGFELFPNDYFCPKNYYTKKITITENTHTIHHFDGSWIPFSVKIKKRIIHILGERGTKAAVKLKRFFLRNKKREEK